MCESSREKRRYFCPDKHKKREKVKSRRSEREIDKWGGEKKR
jgi:hypothetical protein